MELYDLITEVGQSIYTSFQAFTWAFTNPIIGFDNTPPWVSSIISILGDSAFGQFLNMLGYNVRALSLLDFMIGLVGTVVLWSLLKWLLDIVA